jgi:hypothetical protein
MAKSTEQLVADLLDREAIRDLPVRYCHYVWTNDVDGMMGLFTEDGLLSTASDADDKVREIKGAAALRDFYVGLDQMKPRPYIHNHVVKLEGEGRASGTCYVELRVATKAMASLGTGYYDDEYVRDGGVWKFRARRYKAIRGTAG